MYGNGGGKCKDCKHFERGKWHPTIAAGRDEEQMGGGCKLLVEVLKIDNAFLVWQDSIYIQDSFGCSLYALKDEEDE